MMNDFSAAMREAMALTRRGQLGAATRALQHALGKGQTAGQSPTDGPSRWSSRATLAGPKLGPVHKLEGRRARDLPGMRLRKRHAPPIPDGAKFEAREYAGFAGARSFRLYLPAGVAEPRGLVMMLHGCRQDAEDFALGATMNAAAEREGFLVAWPEQMPASNAQRCWHWFLPEHQRRGAGEPAILAGIAQALIQEFQFSPRNVFVAGLSAGGAMALVMGRCYPEIFSAIGVHSGLPYQSARDVVSALAVMRGDAAASAARSCAASELGPHRGRMIVFQGDADRTVAPINAERILAEAGGADMALAESELGGRKVRRGVLSDAQGAPRLEYWLIAGAGHAWSGGSADGTYADAGGPDAAAEMMRFFRAGAAGSR